MNKYLGHIALFGLTTVGIAFGYNNQEVQMGLMLAMGAVTFALLNLDKFKKFKGAGFEAELREQISTVVEKEAELRDWVEPIIEKETERPSGAKVEGYGLVGHAIPVVQALNSYDYTWRLAEGIAEVTDVELEKVQDTLEWLKANELAKSAQSKGQTIWTLTTKGRNLL